MAEILQVFDSFYRPQGAQPREIVHRDGLWHQTFQCWLIRKRDDHIYVLFQYRSPNKKDFPAMLDIPAAGHLNFDETKEDGIREIKEELGIDIDYRALRYLGIRTEVMEFPGFINKEIQHVYLLEDHTPLEEYTLQEEEVFGLVEVELNDGLRLLSGETDEIVCQSVFVENGINQRKAYRMHREDMIHRIDCYYKTIFIMAQRYFSGETYLSI